MVMDLITYCLVMWLTIIQVVRTIQHDLLFTRQNGKKRRSTLFGNAIKFEPVRSLRKEKEHVYRLKNDVLWDTS